MRDEEEMRINYKRAITESREELFALERQLRGRRMAQRVQMLRMLKEGTVATLKEVAPLLGYSLVQVTRWWECYKVRGFDALVESPPRLGKASRMTPDAWAGLEQVMREGKIATLQEARGYLQQEWHIDYKSINALSWLFKQRKIKWKTGRRRHRKANQEQQDTFKKTSQSLSESSI
jgi:transposase